MGRTPGRYGGRMTTLSFLSVPLLAVERGPFGPAVGESEGHINDWPLRVIVTPFEVHIEFADRDGPAFVIDINTLAKVAVNEIEAKLGIKKRMLR